jgi:hypothetical protein
VTENFNSKESKTTEELENEVFDSPSCEGYDINSDRYQV